MKVNFTHSIEFNGSEFPVMFEAVFEYQGIGSYEFWGQQCYDRGELELEELYHLDNAENKKLPYDLIVYLEDLEENLWDTGDKTAHDLINAANKALENKCEEDNRAEYEMEKRMEEKWFDKED